MDFTEKRTVLNPLLKANPISRLLFLWFTPLLRQGAKGDLTIDDLYDRPPEDDACSLGDRLESLWKREVTLSRKQGKKPCFRRAVAKLVGPRLLGLTVYVVINEVVFKVSQPFLLRQVIQIFSEDNAGTTKDAGAHAKEYGFTIALILVTLVYALFIHQIFIGLSHLAIRGRVATSSVIYRKLFRISKTVQSDNISIGKLVNLVASDCNRFDHCFFHISMLLAGPLQVIILGYFLYEELGVSCFIGLGIIGGVLIPFQVMVGRLSAKFRGQIAHRTDERGRMISEIITGIRIIKMYAWEKPFSGVIHNLRKQEILPIRKSAYLRGAFQSLNFLGKITIPFATFIVFVGLGNELTAQKAYFSISVYLIMIQAMAQRIPLAAGQVGEMLVAIRRIESFLLLDELPAQKNKALIHHANGNDALKTKEILENGLLVHPEEPCVVIDNLSTKWSTKCEQEVLKDISLTIRGPRLVMVVGPVGCGKSALLNLLISELPIISGSLKTEGKLAYVSQECWIFSGSIRQNVVFGSLYNRERYERVIGICGLSEDIAGLPQGDETMVGERGVSLSGGQKARVNLARAMFKKADIYLLDDPLSAVDSRVSHHIFQKCIKEHLNGKLRILVTHQLQYLPQADHIVVLNENGEISAQGTYEELTEGKVDFITFPMEGNNKDKDDSGEAETTQKSDVDTGNGEIKASPKGGVGKEGMASGAVTWRTYLDYVTSGKFRVELWIVIALFLTAQGITSFTDKWLSLWTNEVSRKSLNATDDDEGSRTSESTFITVYSTCVLSAVVLVTLKAILFFHYCLSISVVLHDKMFTGLVAAPVSFFDRTPSGRVINRFTKDLNQVDEQLPMALHDTISVSLFFFGIMAVVISTNVFLAIPSVILIITLFFIRKFYLKSARDIKRLDSITKSPIFLHLSASVQGLSTIRGLQSEQIVIDQFDSYLDINTAANFLVPVGNRWLGAWMDIMCVGFLSCVAFSFILFDSASAGGGNVGMAITLTLNLLQVTQWGIRQSAETESYFTSVERILEYCQIKSESHTTYKEKEDPDPPKGWPNEGAVKFSNLSLSYDGGQDLVLKDLSFEVKGKEKIGVIGRTGAGKSSLLVALFRLVEPSGGDILIDNVSTKGLPLNILRRNISIIPQDPILFSGSIRYNLDPFEEYSDAQLWEALREVAMAESVTHLDMRVSDGGSNFSVGQRQLICLARAILRQNKIIVMDEATANVDPCTDQLIQRKIREKFAQCTIITIAHRLSTVLDADRILVMEKGVIKEFDCPQKLLKMKDSYLAQSVKQSGL